ncbi:hypothetical protein MAR_020958 [Mya arenaria]|uniref:Uncharacterized protein n=1 Tax=Mya arenaria TaxID=6604 RepID=A0ABY7E8W2_MYAAR|nr:hypothetical protein MAR_020958 [Mya arenaria]
MAMLLRRRQFAGLVRAVATTTKLASQVSQLSLFMSNSAKSKNNASFEVSDLFGGKEEKVETISDNEDLPKTQDEPIETAEAKHEPEHDIEETVHDVAVEDLKTEESKTNNISVKKPKGYSKYVSSIVSVSTPEAGFYQLQTLLLASDISSGEKVLLAHSALVRILNLTSAQELVKDSSFETLADFVDINGVSLLSDALLSKLSEIVLQVATERLLELVENAGANDLIDTMFRIHSHPHLGPLLDDIALKNLSEFSTTSLYQLLYMQAKNAPATKVQNVKTSLLYLLGVLHVQMGVSSFPVHDDFNTWRTQLQEKVPHTQWMRHISKRIDQLTYLDGLIQKCVKP